MTISSVGNSNAQHHSLPSSEGSFTPTSVGGELAVLMLETEENQKELSREMLEAARADFAEALAAQVRAMRAAADAKLRGATLQAGLSLASSTLGMISLKTGEKSAPAVLSNGFGALAAPLGTMAAHTYGEADAASAQGAQEGARWRMDDARDDVKESDETQDKALNWLSSMAEQDAATMNAILSNKV